MRKVVYLLVRKDDMSSEEFQTYWLEEHAPMVESLPDVRQYSTSVPSNPDTVTYDGIAELYLEEGTSLADVFGTEAGGRIQEDTANFLDNEASELLVVEETVQFSDD